MSARPYKCSVCQGTYIKAEHLIRHERTHTGAKPFPCTICGRSFARGDSLIRHAKVHANKDSRRASTASKVAARVESSGTETTRSAQVQPDSQSDILSPQNHNSNYPQQFNVAPPIYHYTSNQMPFANMAINPPFYTPAVPQRIDPLLSHNPTSEHALESQIDPMLMTSTAGFATQQQQPGRQLVFQPGYTPSFDR